MTKLLHNKPVFSRYLTGLSKNRIEAVNTCSFAKRICTHSEFFTTKANFKVFSQLITLPNLNYIKWILKLKVLYLSFNINKS